MVGNLRCMQGDLSKFHVAVNAVHAEAFSSLFCQKWEGKEAQVVASFKANYLDGEFFSWVPLLEFAGVPKTNNALESFNAVIELLLRRTNTKVSLRKFLTEFPTFIRHQAQTAIVSPFPTGSLDVFPNGSPYSSGNNSSSSSSSSSSASTGSSSSSTSTGSSSGGSGLSRLICRADVPDHVKARVRNQFKEAQQTKSLWQCGILPVYLAGSGESKYLPDEETYLRLRSYFCVDDDPTDSKRTAGLAGLMTNALCEYLRVVEASSVLGVLTALISVSDCLKIADLTGKEFVRKSGFDILWFVLGLFNIYKDNQCTCRGYKHYQHCRHSLAFELLGGRKIPPTWVQGEIRTITYGLRKKSRKR